MLNNPALNATETARPLSNNGVVPVIVFEIERKPQNEPWNKDLYAVKTVENALPKSPDFNASMSVTTIIIAPTSSDARSAKNV